MKNCEFRAISRSSRQSWAEKGKLNECARVCVSRKGRKSKTHKNHPKTLFARAETVCCGQKNFITVECDHQDNEDEIGESDRGGPERVLEKMFWNCEEGGVYTVGSCRRRMMFGSILVTRSHTFGGARKGKRSQFFETILIGRFLIFFIDLTCPWSRIDLVFFTPHMPFHSSFRPFLFVFLA